MNADRSDVALAWLVAAAFAFDGGKRVAAACCLVACLGWLWPLLPIPRGKR